MSKLAPETAEEIRRALRGEPEWRVELTLADFAAWEAGLRDTKIEWAKVEPPRHGEFPALDALPAAQRATLTRRGLDLLRDRLVVAPGVGRLRVQVADEVLLPPDLGPHLLQFGAVVRPRLNGRGGRRGGRAGSRRTPASSARP